MYCPWAVGGDRAAYIFGKNIIAAIIITAIPNKANKPIRITSFI
jgi:hypothetical protein